MQISREAKKFQGGLMKSLKLAAVAATIVMLLAVSGQGANIHEFSVEDSFKDEIKAALIEAGEIAVSAERIQVKLSHDGHAARFKVLTRDGKVARSGACDDDGDTSGKCLCVFEKN